MLLARAAATIALALLTGACAGDADPAAQPSPSPPAGEPTIVLTSDQGGDSELVLRHPDGRLEPLTDNRTADYGGAWSPDGTRIAFVSDRDGNDEVYVMTLSDRRVTQLTRTRAPAGNRAPAWSPDGRQLAFVSTRDGGEGEVYRMSATGAQVVRLTRTQPFVNDHEPAWSPDGWFIVFSSSRVSDSNIEVFRMRDDGSDVTRLTQTPDGVDDNAPRYSPDGGRIVFTRRATNHDLWTMSADGGRATRLYGDDELDDVFPRWTSDGRWLVFQTFERPGLATLDDVWLVRADGTGARKLVATAARESLPDALPSGQ